MGFVVRWLSRLASWVGWLGPKNYKAQRFRARRPTDKLGAHPRALMGLFVCRGLRGGRWTGRGALGWGSAGEPWASVLRSGPAATALAAPPHRHRAGPGPPRALPLGAELSVPHKVYARPDEPVIKRAFAFPRESLGISAYFQVAQSYWHIKPIH